MAAAQAAENYGDEWGLTWYLRWRIYTSIPTWTHSQNSLAAAEALSLKISSHGTSQMITKTIPISTRIVISYTMKQDSLFWVYWKVNGNWDNSKISISQWREAIVEQILASEEINKSKRAGLWESQSDIQVGKLIIWVRSFEITEFTREIITEFTRSLHSTRIG